MREVVRSGTGRALGLSVAICVCLALGFEAIVLGQEEDAVAPGKRMQSVSPEFTPVGSAMCAACHPERVEESGVVRHLRILTREEEKGHFGGCEACHGRGSGHVETADPVLIFGSNDEDKTWIGDSCFVCHTTLTQEKWRESAHWRAGITCNDCHSMHEPESGTYLLKYDAQKGERERDLCFRCHNTVATAFRFYSHHPVLEDRMTCFDCHNLHEPASMDDGQQFIMHECVACHKDKEPPFVFEHEPATSDLSDGCMTCHRAHGSPNDNLHRLPGRAICVQCHTEQIAGHFGGTGALCWQAGCHQQIHGSNTSELFFD